MEASVVICAYTDERWKELVSAIQSAQDQTFEPLEVIVVIDHNQDLFNRVKEHFPQVKCIQSDEPRGLAGARNTGVSAAQGDIIAFLDDDAEATHDWLEHLCKSFDNPSVIGSGGAIEPLWPGKTPAWFPPEFYWVVGCTYRGMPEQAAPVRNLIGANMSFRRKVFEQVNFFSGIGHKSGRPFGGSDPDFCIRVSQCWPEEVLLYQPRALVYHRVSKNRTTWGYFRLRCYNEGLSKSLLTTRVGSKDSLSVERSYTLHTLPKGVLRGISDAFHGDLNGLRRAGAIIVGLLITSAGYARGTAELRFKRPSQVNTQENIEE